MKRSTLLLMWWRHTAVLVLQPTPGAAAELRVGRAATTLTPTEETGGVKPVVEDLYAKAVVLQLDDTIAAIGVLDLPVVNREVVNTVRKRVKERCAIPGSNVMISATHTHTGLTPGGPVELSPPEVNKSQVVAGFDVLGLSTNRLLKSLPGHRFVPHAEPTEFGWLSAEAEPRACRSLIGRGNAVQSKRYGSTSLALLIR